VSGSEGPDTSASPSVSVIVPTFQRREYVQRAVRSVLAQTFTDFELIVVDDGSTDGTGDALVGLDRRLRYHWQPNRGVGAARNAGIGLARGGIVAFLDSDNRWLPRHLAVVTEALECHPQAVLASTCFRFQIRGDEPAETAVVDLLPRLVLSNPVGFVSCIAVRRQTLDAVGGFDERLTVWEDSDLWLRLAVHGPFCLVRCRTLIHQSTRGGLKERGLRSGEYLEAMELSSEWAVRSLSALARSDGAELAARAQAKVSMLAALRALVHRDDERARQNLKHACALFPDFSHDPRLVVGLLSHGAPDAGSTVRVFGSAASLWPDPQADTALFLRAWAAVVALRSRRFRQGARLAVHSGFVARPGFVARTLPVARDQVRAWVRAKLHSGSETIRGTDPIRPASRTS
jgi:glycosyl transferase family 2